MLTEGENELCPVFQQRAKLREKFLLFILRRDCWKAGHSPVSPALPPTYSQRKRVLGISSHGLISMQFLGVKSPELILLLFRTPSDFCFPAELEAEECAIFTWTLKVLWYWETRNQIREEKVILFYLDALLCESGFCLWTLNHCLVVCVCLHFQGKSLGHVVSIKELNASSFPC